MLREIKFQDCEDQRVYFWSDLHWHHKKPWIVQARGFSSIEDHDNYLINQINKKVRAQDILIHAGDLCLNTTEEQFEELLSKINCQNVWCCFGNHYNPVKRVYFREVEKKYGEKEIEVYPFRYRNLIFWGEILECSVNGRKFIISHFSLKIWDYSKHGAIHLSGHSHYSDPERTVEAKKGLCLDIGVDGKLGGPYSFQDIMDIMKTKEIVVLDGHH